jgi:hypothetical protein
LLPAFAGRGIAKSCVSMLAELELPSVCRPLSLQLLYERLITLTLIYLRQSLVFALVSLHPIQTEPRNSMSSFFFMQVALPAKLSVELTDYIMDFLYADVNALRACARVHSSWMPAARKHLYESVHLARPGAWNRLIDVLSQSPEIIPSIKHVTIDGQRQFLQCTMQDFSKLHSLGSLLSNVKSLSLSATVQPRPGKVLLGVRVRFCWETQSICLGDPQDPGAAAAAFPGRPSDRQLENLP